MDSDLEWKKKAVEKLWLEEEKKAEKEYLLDWVLRWLNKKAWTQVNNLLES